MSRSARRPGTYLRATWYNVREVERYVSLLTRTPSPNATDSLERLIADPYIRNRTLRASCPNCTPRKR